MATSLRLEGRAELIGERRLQEAEGENLDSWEISEHFQVPNEMVAFRLGLGGNPYLRTIGW